MLSAGFARRSSDECVSKVAAILCMTAEPAHLDRPVTAVARKDFTTLRKDFSVQEALDAIRQRGAGEKIVYFYVVDHADRLVGVLPGNRRLF